jgi:hypothetical protein
MLSGLVFLVLFKSADRYCLSLINYYFFLLLLLLGYHL